MLMKAAFHAIAEDGWNPPWLVDSSQGWCIHDALLATGDFSEYARATNALSQELGEDVMLWEREPGRTEEDVIGLFERVLVHQGLRYADDHSGEVVEPWHGKAVGTS